MSAGPAGTNAGDPRLLRISLGGSPLTPRIAVWRRDPGFILGVFFLLGPQNVPPLIVPAKVGMNSRGCGMSRHLTPTRLPLAIVSSRRVDLVPVRHSVFPEPGAVSCPPPAGLSLALS